MSQPLQIVVAGLSITSSWGNGHATTYRALVKALQRQGHEVLFLERDVPWYAENRDLPEPPYGDTRLYASIEQLYDTWTQSVRQADFVIVGSYVPDGAAVADWVLENAAGVTAFYDIDTPITLAKLARGDCDYLTPELVPHFDLYLSFTGGPILQRLSREFGAPCARPLYCSVDPEFYVTMDLERTYDLGYMGTYSSDRQPALERLLTEPARRWLEGRFIVAGPQFPDTVQWPANVERIEHVAPADHCRFYNECRFTLNVTREEMVRAGYAPSVRLFEAAACGAAIISDWWQGLDVYFLPGKEVLIAQTPEQSLAFIRDLPEEQARRIAACARQRVLACHTADHRAKELEAYVREVQRRKHPRVRRFVDAC